MAHVEKRQQRYPDGTLAPVRWRARFYAEGRERSKTFARKTDAEKFLATVVADQARGDWIDERLGTTQFRDVAEAWLKTHIIEKPKTRADYRSLLDSRILPEFGDRAIAKIRPEHVRGWVAAMDSEGLSPSRIRRSRWLLRAVLEDAVLNQRIPRNPAAGKIKLSRSVRPNERAEHVLTAAQIETLAGAIESRYRALVYVFGVGGLRWGEAVALRRKDVLVGAIAVRRSLSEASGHLEFVLPKTHQLREVTLPEFASKVLAEHLAACVDHEPDALLFTTPAGTPLRHSNFAKAVWQPALRAAKLPQDVGPHALRHSCASILLAQGCSIVQVQAHLGHRDAATTLRIYSHLVPGDREKIAPALAQAFRS